MSFSDSLNLGIDSAIQSIKDAAGLNSASRSSKSDTLFPPWDAKYSNIKSAFFPYLTIDPNRWDNLFPYRLMVIDCTTNLVVTNKKGTLAVPKITVNVGTGASIIDFEPCSTSWVYTLPISPQQFNIVDQFAINTSATLRGVAEEHNGVRFKMISAMGSFGVWPYRDSLTTPPGTPSILQSLFGGTLEALGSVVASVNNVINAATGNSIANKPTTPRPENSTHGPYGTGYACALGLQQFLEQYAEAKKDPNNASWRLVFDIPKQNQSLVVTPVQYSWQQNANKPMEIAFSLQFKAWRRIDLKQPPPGIADGITPISPGILQRIQNTITAAQNACSAAINLIGAVRSDVDTVFNVIKQTSLLVKDAEGVGTAASDLPSNIVKDFQSAISSWVSTNQTSVLQQTSDPATVASINQIAATQQQNEGISTNAVSSGQLGTSSATIQSLSPANNVFDNPNANVSVLSLVPVASLSLTNAQQNAVNQLLANARATSIAQLKQYRATIQQLSTQLSNSFGTGNAFYSKVYNLPSPTTRIQPITLDEYDLLNTLYDLMESYDILTASTQVDDDTTETNMEYVAGLATTSDITFQTSTSKILAPVPFGKTMEGIAAKYLGDAQRWLEIATLNNLREPYIDENGFQLPLLSNATGRQLTISSDTNLFEGQTVTLRSFTQLPSSRTILGIDKLADTSYLITLNGLANLDNFTIADGAYLQAYLPGTTNSQQKIWIPSDLPVADVPNIIAPTSTSSDPLTSMSQVDWLLNDNNDLAINNFGDVRLASGITNITQALKTKFGTFQGSVLLHPDFGLNVRVGSSIGDIQLQDIYSSVSNMISQDPRFSAITNFQIVQNGSALSLNLGVSLPGQTGVFPVSFNLTTPS